MHRVDCQCVMLGEREDKGKQRSWDSQQLFLRNESSRQLVGNACTERSRVKGAPDNIDDKYDGQKIKRNILS